MASVKEINRPQDFVLPYYGTWLPDSTAVLEIWFFFSSLFIYFFSMHFNFFLRGSRFLSLEYSGFIIKIM